jgi:uncharacterized damage-inducible protein DinB
MIKTQQATFSQTYSSFETQRLLQAFSAGPARIRQALVDLSDSDLVLRPRRGKWSIKETLLHVVDSDLVAAVRIKMVIAQPGSALPFYDQDIWTAKLGHQHADHATVEDSLHLFETLRSSSLRLFESANDDDWQKTGVHYSFGIITLRQLLELYADHSERHIDQIMAMRSMIGKPAELPAILSVRLY